MDDDQESENRSSQFARIVGTWLKPFVGKFRVQISQLNAALDGLALTRGGSELIPNHDARFEALCELIDENLRANEAWSEDERLVVFTEYKTTLDYLYRRLMERYADSRAIRVLFGGMDDRLREQIKQAFNDPGDPVRLLVATDTASEGQNLQETSRFLLHFDIPWNPSRLEQRNGRLDRHGQARDVKVFHFTSDDDADLKFLAYVIHKASQIREDLGSMGEIFDSAFQRCFLDAQDVDEIKRDVEEKTSARKEQSHLPLEPLSDEERRQDTSDVATLAKAIDLSPESLRSTLETALGIEKGLPRLESTDRDGVHRLIFPLPIVWESLIDQTLRREEMNDLQGLAFDPAVFIETKYGRPVYQSRKDTVLMHLGHPLVRQAVVRLNQLRYPGQEIQYSTWTVRFSSVPEGVDCLVLLSVEELAVNELREPFHHWVNTIRIPVKSGRLLTPLPAVVPADDRPSSRAIGEEQVRRAQDIWLEIEEDVKNFMEAYQTELTERAGIQLVNAKATALQEEEAKFAHRSSEVKEQLKRLTKKSLEDERDRLLLAVQQLSLLPEDQRAKEEQLRNIKLELETRTKDLTDLLDYLKQDHDRMMKEVIPKRYSMRGQVQVYPVTLEIRLPEVEA